MHMLRGQPPRRADCRVRDVHPRLAVVLGSLVDAHHDRDARGAVLDEHEALVAHRDAARTQQLGGQRAAPGERDIARCRDLGPEADGAASGMGVAYVCVTLSLTPLLTTPPSIVDHLEKVNNGVTSECSERKEKDRSRITKTSTSHPNGAAAAAKRERRGRDRRMPGNRRQTADTRRRRSSARRRRCGRPLGSALAQRALGA